MLLLLPMADELCVSYKTEGEDGIGHLITLVVFYATETYVVANSFLGGSSTNPVNYLYWMCMFFVAGGFVMINRASTDGVHHHFNRPTVHYSCVILGGTVIAIGALSYASFCKSAPGSEIAPFYVAQLRALDSTGSDIRAVQVVYRLRPSDVGKSDFPEHLLVDFVFSDGGNRFCRLDSESQAIVALTDDATIQEWLVNERDRTSTIAFKKGDYRPAFFNEDLNHYRYGNYSGTKYPTFPGRAENAAVVDIPERTRFSVEFSKVASKYDIVLQLKFFVRDDYDMDEVINYFRQGGLRVDLPRRE